MQRKNIYYSGRVQGVGFRYTTRRIAANYDVTGYVRNLMDGRVELVVEGKSVEVDRFLAGISQDMGFRIRQKTVLTEQFMNEFEHFSILF